MKILAPTRYPWTFNGPRHSRHQIERRRFVPFNYISPRFEGVTVFGPAVGVDLIHAFNRIPLGRQPFIVGFESHLPRGFGIEEGSQFAWMTDMLLSDRCRAIVAISDYARHNFLLQHAGHPKLGLLRSKLLLRYPSVVLPPEPDWDALPSGEGISLVFVGNHFARKGGLVALRIAELATRAKLPVSVEIVSKFEMGSVSWTDPLDSRFFERYRPLLALPNVKVFGALPNAEVLAMTKRADFTLLPTFGDTFGYSVVEGMMFGTPALVTAQAALPEFISDGVNGLMLKIPVNERREWVSLARGDRGSAQFCAEHADLVDRLAEEAFAKITALMDDRRAIQSMRREAYLSTKRHFDSVTASEFWDDLYERTLNGGPLALPGIETVPLVVG